MLSAFALSLLVAVVILVPKVSASATCTNVTLSDVFGISPCLGGILDLCCTNNTVAGFTKLTKCVLSGIFNTGAPVGILHALGSMLHTFSRNSIGPFKSLLPLGNLSFWRTPSSPNFLKTNVNYDGYMKLLVPAAGNYSSCVTDIHLRDDGLPTSPQVMSDFVGTIACLLGQVNPTDLGDIFFGIVCTLRQGLRGISSSMDEPFTGDLSALISTLAFFVPLCEHRITQAQPRVLNIYMNHERCPSFRA